MTESSKGVFTRDNSHRRKFHTGTTFDFVSRHDDWSFHTSLFEGTLHVDKINVWFKVANTTHALPVPVYRQKPADRFHPETGGCFSFTWCRREISSRSKILAPVQQRGWTHAGMTRAGMTFCCKLNKYRAMRGNRSELVQARKSPRCHVNTP